MKKNIQILLVILLSTILASSAYAQKRRSSSAPTGWGVGVRLGDLSGLTAKKYGKGSAFEISIGRTHMFYGSGWYSRRWHRSSTKILKDHPNYSEINFTGYSASMPFGVQAHYLIQKDFFDVPNLQWYYGVGGQFRYQTYHFTYRYKVHGNPFWYYGSERVTDIDIGADGVIGAEYHIPDLPLSVFADVTLFMEILDNPFLFFLQGGVGVRYNFK
ncbi:MAG: hypothetical protein ACK40G_07605 [Cytophagaceae bacterium]